MRINVTSFCMQFLIYCDEKVSNSNNCYEDIDGLEEHTGHSFDSVKFELSNSGYISLDSADVTNGFSDSFITENEGNGDQDEVLIVDYPTSDEEDEGVELLMYFYHNAPLRLSSVRSEEGLEINRCEYLGNQEELRGHSGFEQGKNASYKSRV